MTDRRIQFGAGSCHLPPPWENYDQDANIAQPLDRTKFPDNCAQFVFAEMVMEHVTPREAWRFMEECFRIIRPGGVVRIVIPDFVRNFREMNDAYRTVNGGVTGAKNDREHMESILFGHGHQGIWTCSLVEVCLEAIGFTKVVSVPMFFSVHDELRDCEQHWRSVGKECAAVESGCVEGTKP